MRQLAFIRQLKYLGLLLVVYSLGSSALAQGSFIRIPYGWLKFLIGFTLIVGGIALAAYLYGRATRPAKAVAYAVTAATHMFIWVVLILTLYPVIYLLAVSFNRNNSITAPPPREGFILFRSGVLPDPDKFSLVQYQNLLNETNILGYQWLLIAIIALALLGIIGLALRPGLSSTQKERWRAYLGWTIFAAALVLVVTITPSQFYATDSSGQQVGSTSSKKFILYIRNTLLVSGMTGIMAVLLSTTAGYAFARMKFEGRYNTLLSFVFVQMFPGFMALVAIFYLLGYLGLTNTFVGLILAYSGGAIAFGAWIFKGYLESISPSLEEAAMVDGTTRWGAFWRIILPTSIPMLLFIFLLQFIGTYSEFIMANILLTGENRWTVGIALRSLAGAGGSSFNTQWGILAAAAVLGSIPILIIFYSFQNALTGQYTEGGVKG